MLATNFVVPQGATWGVQIPVVNTDGTDADLTGYTATSQIRASTSSAVVLYAFTPTIDGNIITLQASASDTAGWSFSAAKYDVKITNNGGLASRLLEGVITVDPQVTR